MTTEGTSDILGQDFQGRISQCLGDADVWISSSFSETDFIIVMIYCDIVDNHRQEATYLTAQDIVHRDCPFLVELKILSSTTIGHGKNKEI